MTAILGISAFYHDSAAAIVVDGQVVAAAQEERFSRIKHDATFPEQAIDYCLSKAGMRIGDIDHVVFYEKPFRKFERILETHLRLAPRSWNSFCRSMPVWLRSKLYLSRVIRKGLQGDYKSRIIFLEHHESHAASAFFPSPFDESAILTADGVGEWTTTSFGVGRKNKIELQKEIVFPDSLGLLYSAFTAFCGFRVNGGEGKLMGLAPYGNAVFVDSILEHLVDLKPDGSFRLNQKYFNYCAGSTMTSSHFANLFGGPPREPESTIGQREKDLAASIQKVAEEILMRIAGHVHKQTGCRNLCLAGGVALNCVANGKLQRDGPFENVWIQPAAGDAGGAVGAALFVWHQLLGKDRSPTSFNSQYLGPELSRQAEPESLDLSDAENFDSIEDLAEPVAELLQTGATVGWAQGRMEFGPRALGNRSILASPMLAGMKDKLNLQVKFRESFRPFAPVVLAERAREYFELPVGSPFMLIAAKVSKPSEIPEVTHVDDTARIQTIDADQNFALRKLLEAFESRTGCPVLINTSFNVRGEPIVMSNLDAIDCFLRTDLDCLVLGTTLIRKTNQSGTQSLARQLERTRLDSKKGRTSWFSAISNVIQTITFPIRWLVSRTALTLVYFFLVLPLGLMLQFSNRSRLGSSNRSSYWRTRLNVPSKKQYFDQF